MNISRQTAPTYGSNFSDYFNNGTEEDINLVRFTTNVMIILSGFPINSYVIWLIVTGTGNGLAAEFFSFNISLCEIVFCLDSLFDLINYKAEGLWVIVSFLNSLGITACPLFQCLMCVERYLAVVHPVTFLKYKPLRYRVICSAIAWVAMFFCGGISGAILLYFLTDLYYTFLAIYFLLFLSIQLFCLVSVLRALKQSGPGERRREEENHLKRRAFYLILITTVTMLIILFPYMIIITVSALSDNETIMCIGIFCFIMAGLVQPLLFLYRVGKPPFIKWQ